MTVIQNRVLLALLCPLLLGGVACAEKEPEEAPAARDAQEVIQEMSDSLVKAKTFRVDMSLVMNMEAEGKKHETVTDVLLAVQRPDKVAQILKRGDLGLTLVCDGEKVYTYMPMMESYTVTDAPESLEDLATNLGLAVGDAISAIRAFVADDPGKVLRAKATKISCVGTEAVGGVKCHRLRFEQEDMDWDAWISAGRERLLMKVVPDFAKVMAKVRAEAGESPVPDMKYDMTLTLSNWMTDGKLPDDQFTFKPPKGAIQVESFFPRQMPK